MKRMRGVHQADSPNIKAKSLVKITGGTPIRNGARIPPPKEIRIEYTKLSAQYMY